MYEAYYGLKEKPFSIQPDPEFLFMSKRHRLAFTMLEYGIQNRVGFSVICGEIGCGQGQKFLVRVQPSTVLSREHAANGGRLDSAKKKAREGKRQQFVQVRPMNDRQPDHRQSLRNFAQQFDATRVQGECGGCDDAANHDEQRHRFVFEEDLSQNQNCQRGSADEHRGCIGLVQVL